MLTVLRGERGGERVEGIERNCHNYDGFQKVKVARHLKKRIE